MSNSYRQSWMRSHWLTFTCLLPFVTMLVIHRLLGLSQAFMVATPPGEREAHLYNLVMVGAFYAGVVGYLAHTFALLDRGRGWAVFKVMFLGVGWAAMLLVM